MTESGTPLSRDERLRDQLREGACSAVMQGTGESYLSAFALLLHATPFQIGLLSALPPIVGTWSQLLSVKVLDRTGVRKPLIVGGAAAQALAWLPVLALPLLFPDHGAWLLLVGAMIYFATGQLTVPAWNSVITDMVDADRRGNYFAQRAKVVAVASFLGLSAGGLILHTAELGSQPFWGFAAVFSVAALARVLSTAYLARLQEPTAVTPRSGHRGLRTFIRSRRNLMFRRFLVFSGMFHIAALIAGPFFVVYLLRDLQLTYLQYSLWLVAPIIGQFITLREWGRLADTFGNKKVLVVTGLLIPILPMLYVCTTNWMLLVLVNFLAGSIWPGFSLSLGNYVFDVVHPAERAKGVAVYHTVNAVGAAIGALMGSGLAVIVPSEVRFFGFSGALASNLPILFFVSGGLRLLVCLTLLRTFRERRRVAPITLRQLVAEMPLIRPLSTALVQITAARRRAISFPRAVPDVEPDRS